MHIPIYPGDIIRYSLISDQEDLLITWKQLIYIRIDQLIQDEYF